MGGFSISAGDVTAGFSATFFLSTRFSCTTSSAPSPSMTMGEFLASALAIIDLGTSFARPIPGGAFVNRDMFVRMVRGETRDCDPSIHVLNMRRQQTTNTSSSESSTFLTKST